MKSFMWFPATLAIVAVLMGTGCNATYRTTKFSELEQREGKGPIRALTVDALLYTFETFSFTRSELTGRGTVKHGGVDTPFEGSLPFARIVFIERLEVSIWKSVWLFPMIAGIVATVNGMSGENDNFTISRPSSSCPFVYAFDGTVFRLEAEAFSTSISKALEAQTFSLLPSLVPVNGELTVRVSNERPETHVLNSVHLFAADAVGAANVVLDVNNMLWPVAHPIPPTAAHDHTGKDIIADIVYSDSKYWKSDLAHTAPLSGFRDQLELEFDLPHNASEATLIVHAINTGLIEEVYHTVGTLLGDARLEYYYALEHDAQLQNYVRDWIRESSLRIEVANRSAWREAGIIPPEGNVAPFTRAIRIADLKGMKSPLRLRLSTLTDMWSIDAVSLDASPARPLTLQPLEMIAATSSDAVNQRDAISDNDSSYVLILPPNYIDVRFDAKPLLSMKRPVYVFAAQGYLYEWLPSGPVAGPVLTAMSGKDRIAMFKLLLGQRDILLPPIYAEWRRVSGTHQGN